MGFRVIVSTDSGGGPWSDIGAALQARPSASRVAAAIGYVAATAERVLSLRRGDLLVCDASEQAIRAGLTDPAVLRKWVIKGVAVHSWTGLHAKVVVGRRSAWVGSANASISSHQRLVEAAVRVTDSATVGELRTWVHDLSGGVPALTVADLDKLIALKPRVPFRWPGETVSLSLPQTARRLHLVTLTEAAFARAERAATRDRRVVSQLAIRPSALQWAEWPIDDDVVEGDWWLDVTPGRPVGRPSRVQALRPLGGRSRYQIVWVEDAGDSRRPRRRDLARAFDGELPDDDDLIRSQTRIKKVFDLWR